MKKYLILGALIGLSACHSPLYYSYDGDKKITGQGGFPQYWYSSKELGLEREYPNSGVGFWASGLPDGQKCRLIGYAESDNQSVLAKTILKAGGNIATQSDISLPIQFDKNGGMFDVSSHAGNTTVHRFGNFGANSTTYYGYNVFYCAE